MFNNYYYYYYCDYYHYHYYYYYYYYYYRVGVSFFNLSGGAQVVAGAAGGGAEERGGVFAQATGSGGLQQVAPRHVRRARRPRRGGRQTRGRALPDVRQENGRARVGPLPRRVGQQ